MRYAAIHGQRGLHVRSHHQIGGGGGSAPMRVCRAVVVAVACASAVALCAATVRADAASTRAGLCSTAHAGVLLASGYYSRGDVVFVNNVTCERALTLIESRYSWVLRSQRAGLAHRRGFRLAAYRCSYSAAGPQILKTCTSGRRFFSFL